MPRFARTAVLATGLIAPLCLLPGCSLFRNRPDIEPVQPANPGQATDPEGDDIHCVVSGDSIPKGERQYRYVYRGKTYYCSSEECLALFRTDPEKYLTFADH